jgi:hypothetical protein
MDLLVCNLSCIDESWSDVSSCFANPRIYIPYGAIVNNLDGQVGYVYIFVFIIKYWMGHNLPLRLFSSLLRNFEIVPPKII